jgi:hypothetical protein
MVWRDPRMEDAHWMMKRGGRAHHILHHVNPQMVRNLNKVICVVARNGRALL